MRLGALAPGRISSYNRSMLRALYFVLVGVGSLGYWLWADPTRDISETQDDWPYVLAFSSMLLALGIAMPLLAQLAGSRLALRISFVAGAGLVLGGVVNIFEDGLQMGSLFLVFVLCLAIFQLGILALTITIVGTCSGRDRLLALVTVRDADRGHRVR